MAIFEEVERFSFLADILAVSNEIWRNVTNFSNFLNKETVSFGNCFRSMLFEGKNN